MLRCHLALVNVVSSPRKIPGVVELVAVKVKVGVVARVKRVVSMIARA